MSSETSTTIDGQSTANTQVTLPSSTPSHDLLSKSILGSLKPEHHYNRKSKELGCVTAVCKSSSDSSKSSH